MYVGAVTIHKPTLLFLYTLEQNYYTIFTCTQADTARVSEYGTTTGKLLTSVPAHTRAELRGLQYRRRSNNNEKWYCTLSRFSG